MSQVGATCDRIVDLLNNKLKDQDSDLPDLPNFPEIIGEIDFDHVYVSYENNNHYELKDISFKITPGEQIAILGATGSGKTTLIRLISRFYPISKGKIHIDGNDIYKYNLQSLRRQIGVVPQETFLLGRSILDNLRLGRQDASIDEVVKACRLANIHDFIETLPKKYNNLIGERGVTLSGGQKQRLAIARALIIKPKILIFDDSTSNVDVDTEFKIQQAFSSMFEGTTTFIITQRLSTVRHVDRIIVLSHGKIAEIGSHEELLKHKGIYWQLYSTLKVEERSHGLF
jgi:ABC-type multidrug transport system fused ATPase/permease subunit